MKHEGDGVVSPRLRTAASQVLAEATYRLLSKALSQEGIDHLLLKGPHLGVLAYDKAWERPFCDLDVLVRREQFDVAVAALVRCGFVIREWSKNRAATASSEYHWELVAPNGWSVEIHRELAGYGIFEVDFESLFRRAASFCFGNTPAQGLALEDLVVHLVIHAAKSHFRKIEPKHIADVGRLVVRQPVEWETFAERAKAARCRVAAWVMLTAALQIHEAPVPVETVSALQPSWLRRLWLGALLTTRRFPLWRHRWVPMGLGRLLVMPVLTDRVRDWPGIAWRYAWVRVFDYLFSEGSKEELSQFKLEPPRTAIPAELDWVVSKALGPIGFLERPPRLDSEFAWKIAGAFQLAPRIWFRYRDVLDESGISGSDVERYRDAYAATALYTACLHRVCEMVIQAAKVLGIPIVLLKGIASGFAGFTPQGTRATFDIDVLVPGHQASLLHRKLLDDGFAPAELSPDHHLVQLVHEIGVAVEIHTVLLTDGEPANGGISADALISGNMVYDPNPSCQGALFPRLDVHVTHLLHHLLVQHRRAPRQYPFLFRTVADFADLGWNEEDWSSLYASGLLQKWKLDPEEASGLWRLSSRLISGELPSSIAEEDSVESVLLRHWVAAVMDRDYQLVLDPTTGWRAAIHRAFDRLSASSRSEYSKECQAKITGAGAVHLPSLPVRALRFLWQCWRQVLVERRIRRLVQRGGALRWDADEWKESRS